MELIKFSFPNPEQTVRGAAVNLAYRFGMQTATPFKVSDTIGNEGNPEFQELKDLEGRSWLTSLVLRYTDVESKTTYEFEFIECIITVNQEKNIVATALQGRNGTIKEYISDGDYSITVDAAINNYQEGDDTGASLEYPIDKVKELQKILNLPETLSVQSDFLEIFKVRSVVVKSFYLTQETHSNRQAIQIIMLSDEPYEIKLKLD
ncbi:hypothetical protein GCM10022217_15770 [Chryseobacterium ginsenosidimutans]|uniref:DUF6046 domain-containing protein n=1 Tax=Chryseobacterium ginsenosidimutans TaxID=687846 RepID=UPI0031D44D82